MTTKSPFYIIQQFLSPLKCEDLVDSLDFFVPDRGPDDKPIKTLRFNEKAQELIYNRFLDFIPEIEKHYNVEYKGTEEIFFEWFTEECAGDPPHCENSEFLRKKWVRTKNRDFCGVLFLSSYQNKPEFETDYEVYGGKLEFAQHEFGFNPERGTLVIFPAGPHFINATAPVHLGDLYQCRIHFATKSLYMYDPTQFPGDYRTWFLDIAS
jgi:hypothetical protein